MSQLLICLLVQVPFPVPCFWQACDYFDRWNMAGVTLWDFWGWVLENNAASALFPGTLRSLERPCKRSDPPEAQVPGT